jgi:hypothetical protein
MELTASAIATRPSGIRRLSLTVGAVTTVVAVAGVLWAVLKGSSADADQVSSLPYVASAAAIVGAVLFAWLVPVRAAAGSTGLAFALVSVPLLWAFWSGLPLLVAVAGVVIAARYRAAGGAHKGRALAAMIVGSAVGILTLAALLLG